MVIISYSAANKSGQQSITANLRPLTAHIYHVMIIVTGGFSKKSFFYQYYFHFLEILLNDLELVFLEFKHIYKIKERVCFLFICSFFTCCFVIILCINVLHLFILFDCTMNLFSFCLLFCNHCI